MITGLLSVALSVMLALVPQQTSKLPIVRENVETAIVEALRLVEAKDYRTFLLEFMPPEFVKNKVRGPADLDQWVEYFRSHAAAYALPMLNEASKAVPKYNASKTTAMFPLREYDGSKWYKMIKIGSYWYVDPLQ